MYIFDLSQEPLSTPELQLEINTLKTQRKDLIKYSCISDVLHAFVFIALYFSGQLGGFQILTAVGISTVAGIGMALVREKDTFASGPLVVTFVASVTSTAICVTLLYTFESALGGTLVAAGLGASIVIVGATLGRRVKKVLVAIEEMKPIIDDELALEELAHLCRAYPELEDYREQSSRNLRPHLTYAELKAMRAWAETHALSNGS